MNIRRSYLWRFINQTRRGAKCLLAPAVVSILWIFASSASAEEDSAARPTRPALKIDRWQEDWSPLADPALATQPFDTMKYIPLAPSDPHSYASLGISLRERFESNRSPGFGLLGVRGDSYLLQRLQFHLDVRPYENLQVFTEFEDVRAFDKRVITPVDENVLDLRLAFLGYTQTFESGTLKARIGRQDFAFDLQRFVSSREGPNVRQSFDAIWADWETGQWRILGFVSQPVQYRSFVPFDDFSGKNFRFSTFRVERKVLGDNELSAYYALYERDGARYLDAVGNERRDVFDARFAGTASGLDWDLEAMLQTGHVGSSSVLAWAIGTRTGYTLVDVTWKPRLGIQVDTGTGDSRRGDRSLGTFNPLFPNGYYFTLAGYTSFANLIQVKPSLTVQPVANLTLMAALGLQWRQTTVDAIYNQPDIAIPNTAGRGSLWSGAYAQIRADYVFTPNLTGAVEAVQFQAGETIRRAGGHDSTYLGIELRYLW